MHDPLSTFDFPPPSLKHVPHSATAFEGYPVKNICHGDKGNCQMCHLIYFNRQLIVDFFLLDFYAFVSMYRREIQFDL